MEKVIDVSIIFLTFNGMSDHFEETLSEVRKQKSKYTFEIIVIDSGSTDGTIEFVKSNLGIQLHQIPNSEFGHGKTRQLGLTLAKGKYVVYLTQDATPYNEFWLDALIDNFKDTAVVGVCGRILPREDAFVLKKINVANDLSGRKEKIVAFIESLEEFETFDFWKKRIRYYFFNDISSAVRRDFMLSHPFPNVFFAEDVEFSKFALHAGKKIVYEPDSLVRHSHEYSIRKTFKRNLIDSQYHCEYFHVKNVPTLWSVFRNTYSSVKNDVVHMKQYTITPGEYAIALAYSPVIHLAEQLGQYLGTKIKRK